MTHPKTLGKARHVADPKNRHPQYLQDIARALVERDTPVKVAIDPPNSCRGICRCDSIVIDYFNYCPNCGKPLDWSEKV